MKTKPNIYQFEKLLCLLESTPRLYVKWAMKARLNAIKHLPDKENLIKIIWKRCAIVLVIMLKSLKMRNKILYMLESHQQNKWTIFLDKLNLLKNQDQNTLHIYLLPILLQELISTEKDLVKYWTPLYGDLSKNLLLPTVTDYPDLVLILSNSLLKNKVEKSQSLMINKIKVQNKNYQKTYYQLSTSSVVDRWEEEAIKLNKIQKTIKIPLILNQQQSNTIKEWLNTSNYVYNKTLEKINNGHKINFFNLRDLLVTNITKKSSAEYKSFDEIINKLKKEKMNICQEIKNNKDNKNKLEKKLSDIQLEINTQLQLRRDSVKQIKGNKNNNIENWELNTPKEIRACAVNDVCKAHKTGFSQLESGLIKFFNMKYRKKINQKQSLTIPAIYLKLNNNHVKIAPTFFKDNSNFKIGKSTIKKLQKLKEKNIIVDIKHDSKLIKEKNKFWLYIPITENQVNPSKLINYCGVDPGIRTFLTTFGNNGCFEYKHNKLLLNNLNKQHDSIKRSKISRTRTRKKSFTKREIKKTNVVNEIHWLSIKHLLKKNDVIFYGDIKSHDIVKHKKNHNLNRAVNDLKFYIFKERLLYKAQQKNKIVKLVNEAYTTQTCSFCGANNKPKQLEMYTCSSCNISCGRDINASKNILMKGIVENKLYI